MASHYYLGAKSMYKLRGVHPSLYSIAMLAITLTEQDFSVFCGLRTPEECKKKFADGTGILDSYHLPILSDQIYPTGHAIDVVAWVDGRLNFERQYQLKVAEAMQHAAEILQITDLVGLGPKTGMDWYHWQVSRVR